MNAAQVQAVLSQLAVVYGTPEIRVAFGAVRTVRGVAVELQFLGQIEVEEIGGGSDLEAALRDAVKRRHDACVAAATEAERARSKRARELQDASDMLEAVKP